MSWMMKLPERILHVFLFSIAHDCHISVFVLRAVFAIKMEAVDHFPLGIISSPFQVTLYIVALLAFKKK